MFFFNNTKKSAAGKKAVSNTPHGEDTIEIHLTYSKVTKTLELQLREEEEKLRKKHGIKKEKSGDLI